MSKEVSSSVPIAIVTDGLWRKSLSAIRSLGKAGYTVTVLGDSFFTTGLWSRFTRRRVFSQTASQDSRRFGETLMKVIDESQSSAGPPVILPMEEASLEWIYGHEEKIKDSAHFLIPPYESFKVAKDKGATLKLAAELGLPCPRTWEPATSQGFADQAVALVPGSFVAKPRSGTGSAGVNYGEVQTRDQWISHWDKFGPMLIQERIPSEGVGQGVSLLIDSRGECVAAFAHQRLQQYPNSGGPSTDRQSIHAPELVQWSIELLRRLSWRGIAMVEWKLDPRDNQPKLMEINPRFWGSLELAVRAGVDFPVLYAQAARGEKLMPTRLDYQVGVRCRWLIPGDILRYLTQSKSRRESIGLFLKGLPVSAEEWDFRDIRGAIASLICTAVLALNPRYWKYVRRG